MHDSSETRAVTTHAILIISINYHPYLRKAIADFLCFFAQNFKCNHLCLMFLELCAL
jgi:hypothetical protein